MFLLCTFLGPLAAQGEGPSQWFRDGQAAVAEAKKVQPINGRAKNVILFIGDGMSVTTVTAARILEGQQRGQPGEENLLSFETLPYTALIKTYNTNQQTPDSAGTMTAIVTGVKTKAEVLSLDQRVTLGDHTSVAGRSLPTILELAERAGLSTGVVTTTTVTHATPAACYAHSPHRDWEDDAQLPAQARTAGFPDIARQLIEFPHGDGLEVVLGGGRRSFLPSGAADPEDAGVRGRRLDGRDLTAEWLHLAGSAYVWNKNQLDALDLNVARRVLGLFESGHMEYEHDRPRDAAGEPSLSLMTAKAVALLSKNPKGFFLMVEGGRIDHGHHAANALRALTDTIEFSRAVRVAMDGVDRRETLIVVTADHSHVFTMAGYPTRGNPILGKVVENDETGRPQKEPAKDKHGLPYTTLSYANGPRDPALFVDPHEKSPSTASPPGKASPTVPCCRPDLSSVDTTDPRYVQECTVLLASETHSGEDIPLYADGPQAHLFRGVLEQNVIFHVMAEALGLSAAAPSEE